MVSLGQSSHRPLGPQKGRIMIHQPPDPDDVLGDAADALRALALNERLKHQVMSRPGLARAATAMARRYTAGATVDEAIAAAVEARRRGHAVSIEYSGESVRSAAVARAESVVFVRLAEAIRDHRLPSTISFDLSHVGSIVDRELCLQHVRSWAEVTEPAAIPLMISAEGSERTDLVLDLYEELASEFSSIGITLQARLHRTRADLDRVIGLPGVVRVVKGAFLEPDSVALRRGDPRTVEAYCDLVRVLLDHGQPTSIATHDPDVIDALVAEHGPRLKTHDVEFEMLMGLGGGLLERLHDDGYRTREYVVFGDDWWLYVLNRMAERPDRVLTALRDLLPLLR
jgi:proline dehydrogenase